jgi:DNA-binding NtrC family response regulator
VAKVEEAPKSGRPVVLIAYNGFDSAAATAILLRTHTKAQVLLSSANTIINTLQEIPDSPKEIHILGVGVYGWYGDLFSTLDRLSDGGCKISWYCDRDYLNPIQSGYPERVAWRTEEGVSLARQAAKEVRDQTRETRHLISLAEDKERREMPKILFEAAVARYFELDDHAAVPAAIRKLAWPKEITQEDIVAAKIHEEVASKPLEGKSPQIKAVKQLLGKIGSDRDCRVLILGETGTGKERAARLLHKLSPRARKPFVSRNCANFSDDLVESELFGHEKGAFTGADSTRVGAFEMADEGTLFLDEVGDLTPRVQAKLLRVLQEGMFCRLGSLKEIKVNVRVISATNRDLPSEVRQGIFRSDLYYRLNTFSLHMPALRDRPEDIPIIAQGILWRLCTNKGIEKVPQLSKAQVDVLKCHPWPGNIRELENVLERFVILQEQNIARLMEDSGVAPGAPGQPSGEVTLPLEKYLGPLRKAYCLKALLEAGGNKTRAAGALGISINSFKQYIQ